MVKKWGGGEKDEIKHRLDVTQFVKGHGAKLSVESYHTEAKSSSKEVKVRLR
jgi:hypothetical protein